MHLKFPKYYWYQMCLTKDSSLAIIPNWIFGSWTQKKTDISIFINLSLLRYLRLKLLKNKENMWYHNFKHNYSLLCNEWGIIERFYFALFLSIWVLFAIKAFEKQKIFDFFFHHNFKHIPCYVTSEVSLERFYFVLFPDGLQKLWNWHISVLALKLFMYSLLSGLLIP